MTSKKQKIINRINRIQGQLGGLERMIVSGADCEDILIQLSAAKGAMDQLGVALIVEKIYECMNEPGGRDRIERLMKRFFK